MSVSVFVCVLLCVIFGVTFFHFIDWFDCSRHRFKRCASSVTVRRASWRRCICKSLNSFTLSIVNHPGLSTHRNLVLVSLYFSTTFSWVFMLALHASGRWEHLQIDFPSPTSHAYNRVVLRLDETRLQHLVGASVGKVAVVDRSKRSQSLAPVFVPDVMSVVDILCGRSSHQWRSWSARRVFFEQHHTSASERRCTAASASRPRNCTNPT